MPAPAFPRTAGGGRPPPPRSRRQRLGHAAFELANRLVPKTPGKVVLHSTVDVQDGVLAVLAELTARGRTATVLLEDPTRAALLRSLAGRPVRSVAKRSVRGMVHFLTAQYAMTTHNLYGDSRPSRSQVLVNLWHGEPGSKATGRFGGRGPVHATYAPVCSSLGRALRSAMFDLTPQQVPVVGAPRNDRMLRTDPVASRRALLGDHAGPAFLWLPSYRTGRWPAGTRVDTAEVAGDRPTSGLPYTDAELARLDDWLVEAGAVVVVKPHPRDVARFDGSHRALRVLRNAQLHEHGLTVYTALPAFDALLTDMSSVWIDYLLLDKPMVFAFPDVEAYRQGRGLNLEPYERWVPGRFARTLDELLDALGELVAGQDPMAGLRAQSRLRFHRFLDDRSAARLLDGLGLDDLTL